MKPIKDFDDRKDWEKYLWSEVINHIFRSKTKNQAKKKLEGLFSKHERSLALRRLTSLLFLKEGWSYRKIGEALWISSATLSVIRKSVDASQGYLGRSNKKSAISNPKQKTAELSDEGDNAFIEMFSDIFTVVFRGYHNPQKRWEVISKYYNQK